MVEELPQGYETILGRHFEVGKDLSGGQWQRLPYPAYFRDAHILVSTNRLRFDPRAELCRSKSSAAWPKEDRRFVSHRMASARIADRIMVLKGGCLVEQITRSSAAAASMPGCSACRPSGTWTSR